MLIQFVILQTIIFAVVIYFLKRIMVKDTDSAVNRLETSYEDVKKRKEELAQRLIDIEHELGLKKEEAEKIAHEIKDKAQQEAYAIRDEAFKKAKIESEDIIGKAHKTIGKVKDDIRKELEKQTVDYCGKLLSAALSQVARDELNEVLVKEFLAELSNSPIENVKVDSTAADILSAKPLSEETRDEIKRIIMAKLKKELALSEKTDDALLAGVILRFGSLNLDGSLAAKIIDSIDSQKQKIEERV